MQLSVNADNRAAFSRHSRMLDFQRSSLYASILARSFLAAMPGPHVSADASKVQTQLRPLRLDLKRIQGDKHAPGRRRR
jgi:hypothetical protein